MKKTNESLLQQIASIQRMEKGNLSIIRKGATGSFYNLQYREDGRNKTLYVPRDQVDIVVENTDNYRKASELFQQYLNQKSEESRSERKGKKKRHRPPPRSPLPKKKKSETWWMKFFRPKQTE